MGLITTQSVGFGDPKPNPNQKADPKPVTGFDYAGQPIRDGAFYNGRPEHMKPRDRMVHHVQKNITPKEERTPEQIASMRERMANARAALKRKLSLKKSPDAKS